MLLVSNPAFSPRTVYVNVGASQVVATILRALGLEPNEPDGVRPEGTSSLPAVQFGALRSSNGHGRPFRASSSFPWSFRLRLEADSAVFGTDGSRRREQRRMLPAAPRFSAASPGQMSILTGHVFQISAQ